MKERNARMTYEDYRRELLAALEKADWRNLRDKNGPAYQVLVRASRDRENVTLDGGVLVTADGAEVELYGNGGNER